MRGLSSSSHSPSHGKRAAKGDCSFVRSLGVEVVEAVVSIRPLNVVLADRSSAVTSSGRKGLWLW